MNILEIKDLNFIYESISDSGIKKRQEKYALKGINLDIPAGNIITVCGPTGCGKSTLLRLIKQEIAPQGEKSGLITFEGRDLYSLTQRVQAENIAILFQNPEDQIVTDKVWHELAYSLENLGFNRSDMENRIAEMMSFFRLESISNEDTAKLSGGQKQLVLLASLFAVSPKLLLLDEPISQLDPEASEQFIHTLMRLHDKLGTTIIIAEHKLQNLLPISDRIIVMSEGRVAGYDTPTRITDVLNRVLPPYDTNRCAKTNDHSETILTLKDIYFRYSLKSPDVLSCLRADFKKGCSYAIFGCNAAGKTTLLNLIAGLYKPQEGTVKFNPKRLKIGYMPQNTDLLFISDTVKGELKSSGISPDQAPAYIQQLDPERSPFDLSGGEKQLLALAKISASDPDILLLDEPTKGVDVILSKILLDEINRFTENGKTVIMSTHDIAFAKAGADMCSIMSMGRLTAFKTNKDFFESNKLYSI